VSVFSALWSKFAGPSCKVFRHSYCACSGRFDVIHGVSATYRKWIGIFAFVRQFDEIPIIASSHLFIGEMSMAGGICS